MTGILFEEKNWPSFPVKVNWAATKTGTERYPRPYAPRHSISAATGWLPRRLL